MSKKKVGRPSRREPFVTISTNISIEHWNFAKKNNLSWRELLANGVRLKIDELEGNTVTNKLMELQNDNKKLVDRYRDVLLQLNEMKDQIDDLNKKELERRIKNEMARNQRQNP